MTDNETKYWNEHLKRLALIKKPLPTFNIIKTEYAGCNKGPFKLLDASNYKMLAGISS